MRMQYRALALQVGATVEELPNLVFKLSQEQQVDARVAQELLTEMRNESTNKITFRSGE